MQSVSPQGRKTLLRRHFLPQGGSASPPGSSSSPASSPAQSLHSGGGGVRRSLPQSRAAAPAPRPAPHFPRGRPRRSSALPPPGRCLGLLGSQRPAGLRARAGGGPRAHCAPGEVAAALDSAPCAHFSDGFSTSAVASPSPQPPSTTPLRIPAACLYRLQPRCGQSCRVFWPRRKLLWFRCRFLRAQRVFVSGPSRKGRPPPPLRALTLHSL